MAKDNQIKRVDFDALDSALKVVLETLAEISKKQNLSQEDVNYLTEIINDAYVNRKANIFINKFTVDFEQYLNHAFKFAMNQESNELSDYTKRLYYYKSKKHLIERD